MEDNNQDYENEDLQTQQDLQDDMQNIASTATNMLPKRNKDKSAGKALRAAGKALHLTGQIVEKTGSVIKGLGKGIKWLGRRTYEGGKNLWNTGKALCETGIGAIAGIPICVAAGAVMGLGKLLEGLGWSLEQIGKVLEFLGRKIQDAAQAMINKANKQIQEAGGSVANALGTAGAAGAAGRKKASNLGDNDNDGPKTGGIPSLTGFVKNNKVVLIIIAIIVVVILFLVLYLLLDEKKTIDDGSFADGDKTNVPYTVSSVIMDNLVIVSDGSGGYTYGFKNESGEVVDLDQAIDSTLKSLKGNKSDSLGYLGENNEERKSLLKKMVMAEIATQYPDLTNSESNINVGNTTQTEEQENEQSTQTQEETQQQSQEDTTNTSQENISVDDILASMTLEEKIYQMLMPQGVVTDGTSLADVSYGGYIVGSNSNYDANLGSIGSNNKIKPFVATDDEGGKVERAAQGYDSAKSYGDSQNYDKLYNDEVKKSNYLLGKGITLNLGPDADVVSSGAIFDLGRSYSSDANIVKECIKKVLQARATTNVNGISISSALKHYPGYPDNDANTDHNEAVDDRSVEKINENIDVFKSGINAGAESVMITNVIYSNLDPNNPATFSSKIISELRSNFNGVIMTDDIGSAVSGLNRIPISNGRFKKAVIAGNDMLLMSNGDVTTAYSQIKDAVESGEITEERINESVTRILNWKANAGILSAQTSNTTTSTTTVTGTGSEVISDKFNKTNTITGGIKVQRKLENGATIDLKYTSTENFNALLSANSDDVMNYYTLQKNAKTTGSSSANFSGSNNAEVIWNFLRSKGLSEVCTAAIIGNLMAESELNTGLEEVTARIDKGYGLAQWTFGRRNQINYYANLMNKEVSDIELQLQFLWLEIDPSEDHTYANLQWGGDGYGRNGEALFQQFISITDIDEATAMFCWAHERPSKEYANLDNRKEYAKEIYATYSGKSVSSDNTISESNSDKKSNSVSSFDNFLFIGDSRYEGISSELSALGNNISVCGVSSSFPHEWVDVTSNGSGTVQGKNITLPDTATNISVMLGVNNLSETSQMEQVLNNLHERYKTATIYVNSVYHLGTSYSGDATNSDIDAFNDNIRNFCNQNSWAEFIDITEGLDDDSGNLKSEYCDSSGLHIISQEGKQLLVNNIKSAISGSNSSSTNVSMATTSRPGYSIIVANKTKVTTNLIQSYDYISTNYTDVGHNSYTDSTKRWSNPASGPKSSNTTQKYSSTSVAYQEALKNYTLYFDFLWAILVETENKDLVEGWANLVCNNVGENSKVTVTAFLDQEVTNTQSSNSRTTNLISNNGSVVVNDKYNLTETMNTTTTTLTSKLVVTFADTWLMKYENNVNSYDEYASKEKEVITEKIDPKDKESNAIKILKKNSVTLKTLKKEKYMLDEMLADNEKVSFMVDVFSYILDVANGKNTDEKSLSDILDAGAFNLETFKSSTGSSTSLGEMNGTFLEISTSIFTYIYENNFKYGHGTSYPVPDSQRFIDCTGYVTWVLYKYGYTEFEQSGQLSCSVGTMVSWANSNLEKVWEGCTHDITDVTNIQPGDIVVMGKDSQAGGELTQHAQIFAGYNDQGKGIWYSCGGPNIGGPATKGVAEYNGYSSQAFLYVYRVPSN